MECHQTPAFFHDIEMVGEDSENLKLFSSRVVFVFKRRKQLGKVGTGCHGIECRFDPALGNYCIRGFQIDTPIVSNIILIRVIWHFRWDMQVSKDQTLLFDAFPHKLRVCTGSLQGSACRPQILECLGPFRPKPLPSRVTERTGSFASVSPCFANKSSSDVANSVLCGPSAST